ncbi:MAG: thymidine phosphorylase [Anaerolineales bacterium]|nr:thymidine phosphorylase [Chloroflexota bacterium]MBL6983943.1 thymidine phosphorylase [Anaerolineales bacterium]
MRAIDVIAKKRDKGELTKEEIIFFVQGYVNGHIPDYQAAAWAMAVLLNGMSPQETTDLTLAIVDTGETIDLSQVVSFAVDKHSTGGVGDKTTLVVEPLVSACGLPVGKMSGRGLGFTGGTLDKIESIPGFDVTLTTEEFLAQIKDVGLVLAGQTADLAPADGKLYALRDVTATVDSIPLIASSIMSKKIAGGAHGIVLDVKSGLGAFMGTLEEARQLAELMVDIAHLAGRKAVALLSDMNQPLGNAVGNAIELIEAIDTLQGGGPEDFKNHCLEVAAHMLTLGGVAENLEAAAPMMENALSQGLAWERFRELVIAQDGDVAYVDDPQLIPKAALIEVVHAPRSGYIEGIHAGEVGIAAVVLGAGREKKGDPVDHAVGFEIHRKVGDFVERGEPLFTIHANDQAKLTEACPKLLEAHTWSDTPVEPLPLFYGVIS